MTPDERRRAVYTLDGMIQGARLVLGATQEKALRDEWKTHLQDPLCGALENVDRALEVAANYLARIKEDQ